MQHSFVNVTCPSCFQIFKLPAPPLAELPAELDYDCEICCRPMMISVYEADGNIEAEARGLDD